MSPTQFSALPADILLQVVSYGLDIDDAFSLSMVSKYFHALSAEHSFWLPPLQFSKISRPLPVPTVTDLREYSSSALKKLALHARRLTRNWAAPRPVVTGPIKSIPVGVHNSVLYCLPGTASGAIVLYSLEDGTAVCLNTQTGQFSSPTLLGRIHDMSSPIEQLDSYTVTVLVDNQKIVVLTASCSPNPQLRIICECDLELGYQYTSVFMNSFCAGVVRASLAAGSWLELQTFSLENPMVSSIVVTDCPGYRTLGSAVVNDAVFIVALQHRQAAVYACPRRLMAGSDSSSSADNDIDFTLGRNHVGHIPSSSNSSTTSLTHFRDYCVLSTEPYSGRSTISVVRGYAPDSRVDTPNDVPLLRALEITFWPRPNNGPEIQDASPADYDAWEKGLHRKLLPAETITVEGGLSMNEGNAWELLVIANSGLAVLLLVDPPSNDEPGTDSFELRHPKLMLVRFDPVSHIASQHELVLPEEALNTRDICAIALDDHLGVVILVTADDVLRIIPYA
ncbi:F-box domain-containing protein [Mycena indigotica]|uniref:F-box domain-containing protein n=1 Tax=Mycena indigotica TaxID=2126181 RepID=A0A8H6TE75_9AGAR|nr:F-box domain-containing protein [Mycena indigotica]KAF7315057.1 F-box domain-containing protein [Mycena indigotica]